MSDTQSRAERRENLEAAEAIENYQPTIPTKVRDGAYIGGLIVAGVVAITVPTVAAIAPDVAGVAAQIGAAVSSGVGLVVAGLGVVYRPGAQH